MVTDKAKERQKILIFWEKHGLEATLDAFPVKRRTLFNWKARFNAAAGKLEALNAKSRAPQRKRKRVWDTRILEEIRRLRKEHPNQGAQKLHPLLLDFCDIHGLSCPKPVTIERLIKDMGGLRTIPQKITGTGRVMQQKRQKNLRKPAHFKAQHPGHCIALDTVEKQRKGRRMYIVTAIDLYTRTAFAIGTKSHGSHTTAHFFSLCVQLFPYPVTHVLTDNGSEFKKYFRELLKDTNLTHYHTKPRTPKMNAHCESFNGTIQAEFVDFHVDLLFDDVTAFNEKLREYLVFYNTKRVHSAFKNKYTPFAVLNRSEYYVSQLPVECKNGWGQSSPSHNQQIVLCSFYQVNLFCTSVHH